MLTSLGLLLARAKRKRQPVPVCLSDSFDIAHACLDAAEKAGRPIILAFDQGCRHERGSLIQVAVQSSTHIGLMMKVTDPEDVDDAMREGVPAFWFESDIDERLRSTLEELDAEILLSEAGPAQALILDFGTRHLSIPALAQTVRTVRVPVIIRYEDASQRWLAQAAKAGVSGFVLNQTLSQAYTAGLRTSLRDRNLFEPQVYNGIGREAVRSTVSSYFL